MSIQKHQSFTGQTSDGYLRTEFFSPDMNPTIAGDYECSTGSGYVLRRHWNGSNWISPINGAVTTVRMMWRGLVPERIEISLYPSHMRQALRDDRQCRYDQDSAKPHVILALAS